MDKRSVVSNSFQEKLNQLYLELGKAYYEGAFEDPLPQLLPIFDDITRLKKRSQDVKLICPQCGAALSHDTVFCGECGYKVK